MTARLERDAASQLAPEEEGDAGPDRSRTVAAPHDARWRIDDRS
jgi:hypothetical protein